ncbi:ras GTPase-activating protein [Suillus paluster]|uniref:ras GTPase-activating protein n=1 Tax=Suillus paluster TaxID=48578 RepID=UPI001B87A8E1|nr:ras GTPase-activating protein [Suillus paluster]KAG1754021.1 ras GTPase-activating protein [Suillus paluster]
MDKPSTVPPASPSKQRDAFAYQTRLLQRTSSRSSTNSLTRNSSISSRPTSLVSPTTTGSSSSVVAANRRWTPSHRPGTSLDLVRDKWEERARAEAALEGRRPVSPTKQIETTPSGGPFLGRSDSISTISSSSSFTDSSFQRTPTYLKRHTVSPSLPPHIVATPLSPNTTGITVENPDSPTSSFATPTPHRIRLPTSASLHSSSISDIKELADHTAHQPISLDSPSPPMRRTNTLDNSTLDSPTRDSVSRTPDPTVFTVINPPSSPSKPLFTPTTIRRRPTSLYGPQSSPEKDPLSGRSSASQDLTDHILRTPTRNPRVSDHKPPDPTSKLPDLTSRISAYTSRFDSRSSDATSRPVENVSPSVPPTMDRTSRVPDLATRVSEYTSRLNSSERPSPSPTHTPTSSFASTQNSFTSASSSHTPSSSIASIPSTSSVMSPTPYRSSYMANKKTSTYGQIAGRKLGRHLPRIASGDAGDDWVDEQKPNPPPQLEQNAVPVDDSQVVSRRARRHSRYEPPPSPVTEEVVAGMANTSDVSGIPGRLRLSRDKTPASPTAPTPLPSSRLTRGLWADVQRHLLQAYEYLCHVGEAQQWIEGCLGEELGFGVVEMEEGMRNGVVLARLVRVFKGEGGFRIYEARKLNFRHSDNINHFFVFVREVGLPEGFIFELTDLYEKKNFPKVIYCIHALSHLLARRGLAECIGDLLGQLQFSDDQLQKTQKGLTDAGIPMPNFGNVGRELAKEINEEPDPPPPEPEESEEERRDRLLLENEDSIRLVQCLARGFLVRKAQATQRVRLRLTERYVPRLQAHLRGALARRTVSVSRQQTRDMTPWAVRLQAAVRGALVRRRWRAYVTRIKAVSQYVVKTQAQIRGVLVRRRFEKLKAALRSARAVVVKMQSTARAKIAKRNHSEVAKTFARAEVALSVVNLQATARGFLRRRAISRKLRALDAEEGSVLDLQAQCRGVLVRRRIRTQLAKLDDVSATVVRIQAAVRTYLARKRLLQLIRGLRRATPMLIGLQARARASLARQQHHNVAKALSEVKVVASVGGFQALARAAIMRNRHREQQKKLAFVAPDVNGLEAVARGYLVRREYHAWRDHLRRSQPAATMLQALLRGVLQRKKFRAKMQYYRTNLDKVVKIQSLFRAKETREQYRQLTLGKNVTVGTIKNFVHLLDDSEADFQDEIKVERLRKRVVEGIRENQALESDVSDLDVKIALVVQNVKSFEELIKARKRYGADSAAAHATRASILAAHGDPFAGPNTLDHAAKKKLELYQQLFYLLQTRAEYLSGLFVQLSDDTAEKHRRLTERVVLTLFGYGQDRREDYLFLKLFQLSIRQEILAAPSISDVVRGHPMYINIAVQYVRPRQVTYIRETLQGIIRELMEAVDLDLESDPTVIHRSRINVEEMRSGIASTKPKDVPFYEALKDPDTRAEYIRHLQKLQWWTEAFAASIFESTRRMPYSMRFVARETLLSLKDKFPGAPDEVYAACIGRLVYYRYLNPAILSPENFDMVASVDIATRKNLAQISKVLTQVASGSEFSEDQPNYVPINECVRTLMTQMTNWLVRTVADVPDAESHYHAHEFLDATVQPKPIYISPNEVYGMHVLLSQYQEKLSPARHDALRVILHELDGVPHLDNDELKDARDRAVTLELTNRFAHVRDPKADEKALWVQAKRGVLAILRVQPAQDLVESLMRPVSDNDELRWETIVTEMDNEPMPRRMPSTSAGDSAYRLEDIRSLSFKEVKAHAIFFLLELEKQGKITRSDGFQGILNAIASDVRSKHRKRLQRQQEMDSMVDALKHLSDRKTYFEEQIDSYHNYVEAAMATMQRGKGKKRFVLPFTKQYFHLRDLQKSGKNPQFGSFKYSAKDLYEKGILLSIDQFSPRQFDKIDITISSNKPGIFTMEVFNNTLGITNRIASSDLRMEDLLQAQFENQASLPLFNGLAKVNISLLLYQINKKFYV